ncbi:cholecystokinin receptor-like [Tachypleus tridentatus]|uniref:cholecystokinin receptor-like n=1 Tax=Tachypleus tridentatus TaxID=6853 RepID=UPI003FD457D7
MRTVTNVFLMNLAISDLLLGVFCMPFTLVGSLLRNFIFGDIICRLIPYLQAVSVSVSVWTLVSISFERYFAICQPFRSRQWQTISHSYKVIICIWVGSLLTMLPIAVLSRLLPTNASNRYKCRDVWPNIIAERAFNLYLVAGLLVVPLLMMTLMYSLIVHALYTGFQGQRDVLPLRLLSTQNNEPSIKTNTTRRSVIIEMCGDKNYNTLPASSRSRIVHRHLVVRGNYRKGQLAKKRVIRMLFVIVLNFFICWMPLFVVNTWTLYDASAVYRKLPPNVISFIHLMAYLSSCCNPIIYSFMHKKYRQAFMSVFNCRRRQRSYRWSKKSATLNSM